MLASRSWKGLLGPRVFSELLENSESRTKAGRMEMGSPGDSIYNELRQSYETTACKNRCGGGCPFLVLVRGRDSPEYRRWEYRGNLASHRRGDGCGVPPLQGSDASTYCLRGRRVSRIARRCLQYSAVVSHLSWIVRTDKKMALSS